MVLGGGPKVLTLLKIEMIEVSLKIPTIEQVRRRAAVVVDLVGGGSSLWTWQKMSRYE